MMHGTMNVKKKCVFVILNTVVRPSTLGCPWATWSDFQRFGFFPATMRNFTKSMVCYSAVAVWPCTCELACDFQCVSLAPHFSQNHSLGGRIFVSWV